MQKMVEGRLCGLLGTCLCCCRRGELGSRGLSFTGSAFMVAGELTEGNVFCSAELPLVGGEVAWRREVAEVLCVLACPFRMCTSPTCCG